MVTVFISSDSCYDLHLTTRIEKENEICNWSIIDEEEWLQRMTKVFECIKMEIHQSAERMHHE